MEADLAEHADTVDGWEVWIPGGQPSTECVATLGAVRRAGRLAIGVAPIGDWKQRWQEAAPAVLADL